MARRPASQRRVDATDLYDTVDPSLVAECAFRQEIVYLALGLTAGDLAAIAASDREWNIIDYVGGILRPLATRCLASAWVSGRLQQSR